MDYNDASMAEQSQIRDAVLEAWQGACPDTELEPHLSWREAGLDSLKALEFMLRLERLLGRPISFDQLTAESTAEELIQAIAIPSGRETGAADAEVLFLIPGALGDEPKLADLRYSLSPQIKTRLLALPDLEAPTKVLTSVAHTAARCKATLKLAQPHGSIRLAGFSYGAIIAQELARQLEGEGRTVEFLGAIDGLFMLSQQPLFSSSAKRRDQADDDDRRLIKRRRSFDDLLFALLFRVHALDWARRYFNIAARRNDWAWSVERRRWLLGALRYWAVRGRTPRPCNAPTLLITSNDFEGSSSVEAWRQLCPKMLDIVPVSAGHLALFEGKALETVCRAFFAAWPPDAQA